MKLLGIILLTVFISGNTNKEAYRIVNKEGADVEYTSLIKTMSEYDIVFIGEYHNNAINHWLELQFTKDLYKIKEGKIILGAEMFEADDQIILDEYLSGLIKHRNFSDEAKLWPNYETDYKPLIEFAKENNLKFIATNVPRRYASLVANMGFEGLEKISEKGMMFFPPLPINYDPELNCYKQMLQMKGMGRKVNENLPKAQALKDATMAYFIQKNLKEGYTFIHYNGAYHSDYSEGIIWHLKKLHPNLKILIISTEEIKDINSPATEDINKGDYTILIPEDMTKTY